MNAYMRGFVILFVLLVLLSYLPPGKQYRKYIRFYAQLLMVLAALRPLFVLFGGKDTFYEKMAYAQCMEKLSEFSRDTQKTDESADEISVRRISVSDAAESGKNQEVCGKVKEELAAYYGMEDSGIRVSYVGGT